MTNRVSTKRLTMTDIRQFEDHLFEDLWAKGDPFLWPILRRETIFRIILRDRAQKAGKK